MSWTSRVLIVALEIAAASKIKCRISASPQNGYGFCANQQVKGTPGFPPGEEPTLSRFYTSHWNDGHFGGKFVWSHRYQNMLIMVGFIVFFRFATFYALERINYSTR